MGFLDRIFGGDKGGHTLERLAGLLDVSVERLQSTPRDYVVFTVPKRRGGVRRIDAPNPELKALQRRILRRVLAKLKVHPAAHGFEKGRSIVTNALPHASKPVVIRIDVRNFFHSTKRKRVLKYFRKIGWSRKAAKLLTDLCTHNGSLPQGAPTSPRLANLVNHQLDARMAVMAESNGGVYTRYADDVTISFIEDHPGIGGRMVYIANAIFYQHGYRIHGKRKRSVRRAHQRQQVTGLVVNELPGLPREVRRKLRAVEHRLRTGRAATMTRAQLDGWRSLQRMIANQVRDELERQTIGDV